jgi:hypothetical protein
VREGASDVQLRTSLGASAAPRLHLESAEGLFGGWADGHSQREFEGLMDRFVFGGSWCCSSWYKPSGSFDFANPAPTRLLPPGCAAAPLDAPPSPPCAEAQARRRAQQRPLRFFGELGADEPDRYVPDTGKRGQDGYYVIRRPGALESRY